MIKVKPKKKTVPAYDAAKAKAYADRVKALLVERSTINHDISQVCEEAKEDGCEPALIRYVAREMMLDDDVRRERDEKRARYLHAVGLAVEAVKSGELSARQAAKIYSIGKTSIYKEMGVRAMSANREMLAADFELHDADGVVTETHESCGQSSATVPEEGDEQVSAAAPGPHDADMGNPISENEAPATPSVGAVADGSVAVSAYDPDADGRSWPVRPSEPAGTPSATGSVGAVASASERVAPNNPDDDDLEFPPFLRRQTERVGA